MLSGRVWYASGMATQDELRAEFRRLFDEDRIEEASAVLDLIEIPPFEVIKKMLDEAPIDDEPISEMIHERLRLAEERSRARVDSGR
jgi:hypothetical protein